MNLAAVIARAEETLRLADSVTLESTEGQYAQAVVQLRDALRAIIAKSDSVFARDFPPSDLDSIRDHDSGRRLAYFVCAAIARAALSHAPKEGE